MSLELQQIKEQLGDFASKYGPKAIVPAIVLAVNTDDTIKVAFSDDSEIDDVRLKSVVKDGNKVLLIPAVASTVMVARIENSDEFIVIAVDEVSKLVTVIDTVRQEIDSDGFVFKKGNNTLWDAMKLLFEALEVVVILQGKQIDFVKLAQAKVMCKSILNGT
jgi:hypothetical protein